MSLNRLQRASGQTPFQMLQNESMASPGHAADIELCIPPTIQGPKRSEVAKGRLWVTDKRVVFYSDSWASSSLSATYDAPPQVESLVVPYNVLLDCSFNVPLFSANNLVLSFLPDPSDPTSGLPSPGRGSQLDLKIVFSDGSGHAVWKSIEWQKSRWEQQRQESEVLPAYSAN